LVDRIRKKFDVGQSKHHSWIKVYVVSIEEMYDSEDGDVSCWNSNFKQATSNELRKITNKNNHAVTKCYQFFVSNQWQSAPRSAGIQRVSPPQVVSRFTARVLDCYLIYALLRRATDDAV